MSYCINPLCDRRKNQDSEFGFKCSNCGTQLLINNRIRLIKPLRELNKDPFSYIKAQEKIVSKVDAKLLWEACLILNSDQPEVQGWRQEILQRLL